MKSRFLQLLIIAFSFTTSTFSQNWVKLNGPIGTGIINAIITKEKSEIYCASQSGRIFFSSDMGNQWTEISEGLIKNNNSNTIIMKESPSGIIYISYYNQLFYLDKSLKKWIIIALNKEFENFAFSPDGKIYGGDNRNFYHSLDGINFNTVQSWWTHTLEFLCLGGNNNFVRMTLGASGEIWKFNHDGKNMIQVLTTRCCQTMFFHKKTNTLFDLSYYPNYSQNDGLFWAPFVFKPGPTEITNLIELNDGSLLTYSKKFYRSIDGGVNWDNNHPYDNNYNDNLDNDDIITTSNADDILICNQKNAFLISPNKTIKKLELPIDEPYVYDIVQFGDKKVFTYNTHSNQISLDDGNSWKNMENISPLLFWKDGTMASVFRDTLEVSSDQFKTSIKNKVPDDNIHDNLIMDNNENLVLYDYNKNYISYDKGKSWNLYGEYIDFPYIYSGLKFSKQNILYGSGYDSIYYSLDYGLNWNKFLAQGIEDVYDLVLTKNNIFIWFARDDNSNYAFQMTRDFGKTIEVLPVPNQQFPALYDEHENIYSILHNNLYVYNLLSKTSFNINLSQLGINSSNIIELHRGQNDYLYAVVPNSTIFKYDQKLNSYNTLISGNVILDEDNDCKKSVNENKTRSFQLELVGTNLKHEIPILPNGEFKAYLSNGTYDLRLKKNSLIWDECNFPKQFTVQANSNTEFKDIMIQPTELCADLYINMVTGRLRRCFDNNSAEFTVRNEGSASAINSKVTIIFDDYYEILHSSMNPSAINGNVWEFTIPEIADGQSFRISFTFKISCTAELGQEHCIQYLSDNPQACKGVLPIIDTSIICERNVGAFDPNDKTAFVNGNQSDAIYKTDSLIKYLIRFQNTGTDTAFNIRITDKLDYHLDWSSVNILSSSHPNSYSINESGLLEFEFKNIMLPDSNIDEMASNGYVMYSIKPKLSQLKFGTLISNKADIYFDYNEAVATNTAVVKLTTITKVNDIHDAKALELKAVPNPTDQWTSIALPDYLRNKSLNVKLTNSSGRELRNYKFSGSTLKVERNELFTGIYFLSISDQQGLKAYSKIIFN